MSSIKPQNLFAGDKKTTKKNIGAGGAKPPHKQTHIEVCARIRPLQISMQSSSSYFGGKDKELSPHRKPPVPRKGIQPPKSTGRKNKEDARSPVVEEDIFYAWDVLGDDTATQSPRTDIVPGRTHQYTLDKVYAPDCTTKDLYKKSVKPLVMSAMEGYHSAVLAYGQTSTGKTFSMTGTPTSPGIIPLAIHQCFQCLEKEREYLIRISYLEVYKEQIRDLLADGASQIRLFDHREQGLIIKGLREEVVTCPKQIFEILAQGEKRRKIGATNMNQHSSRSHVMVRLWIESRSVEAGQGRRSNNNSTTFAKGPNGGGKGGTPVRVSSLSLVDLAGSESVKLHGANEARRQEGHYINKSLMALGKVVYALSERSKQDGSKTSSAPQHIPYRDSKLTRLLQPSLSGNAQMVLICCISPLATHIEESHNTFKFAARAKKVQQKATIQESVDEKTLLQTYREEIEALRQQLLDAKKQQETLLQAQQQEVSVTEEEDIDDEVEELKLAIRKMEHLIVKSKAPSPAAPIVKTMSEDEFIDAVIGDDDDDDNEDDEEALLALMTETQKSSGATQSPMSQSQPVTPTRGMPSAKEDTSADMHTELHRIQGLLGSVLKKRSRGPKSPNKAEINGVAPPGTSIQRNSEVNQLRAQLEEQEVASSLRKADASFLQKQLEEKDNLLAEISKVLEQVETRQLQLEAENASLKKQLALYHARGETPTIKSSNGQIEV